jgi:hypothetical protein
MTASDHFGCKARPSRYSGLSSNSLENLKLYKAAQSRYRKILKKLRDLSPDHPSHAGLTNRKLITQDRLNSARTRWNQSAQMDSNTNWSKLCEAIESKDTRKLVWKRWNKTKPSGFKKLNCITTNKHSPIPSSEHESMNILAAFYSKVMSPSPLLNWDTDEACSSSQKVPPHHPLDFVKASATHQMDATIEKHEIEKACKSINSNTTQGPDSVSPHFIKHASAILVHHLHHLFNLCWRAGHLPQSWVTANSIALFKGKGSRADPSSYRLVSVTSIIMRAFERIVKARMNKYLEDTNFFHDNQSGFRHRRTTYDNIYDLQKRIYQQLEHKRHMPVAFLDITKAFDRVPHRPLLSKLYEAGITGCCWYFIKAFLSNRFFRITNREESSNWFSVTAGVPQGSVIAPLLFIIYINDIISTHIRARILMFADDIVIIPRMTTKSPFKYAYTSLKQALSHINKWSKGSGLEISHNKSKIVIFANAQYTPPPPFKLGQHVLSVADEYTYLGITLPCTMRGWKSHADQLFRKIRQTAHMIARTVRNFYRSPGPMCALTLVRGILLPQISYSLPFFRPTIEQYKQMNRITAYPLKVALGLPKCASTLATLTEFGLSTTQLLRDKLLLNLRARSGDNKKDIPPLGRALADDKLTTTELLRDMQLLLNLRARSGDKKENIPPLGRALADDKENLPRPPRKTRRFCRSIAVEIDEIQGPKWEMLDESIDIDGVVTPFNKSRVRKRFNELKDEEWNVNDRGKRLREIKRPLTVPTSFSANRNQSSA